MSTLNVSTINYVEPDANITLKPRSSDGVVEIQKNAGILNLVGTDHCYIQWYPDGKSAGRKAFTGYGSGSDNTFYVYNEISGGNVYLYSNGGSVLSNGDIIAFFSDIRLKKDIEIISNALDKVCSLKGFTYNFNEIAEELGYNSKERYSGVSAQEVQKVLPEAVKPAPVDDKYLTVQYEKLVPLLIEAIKELRKELDELKGGK